MKIIKGFRGMLILALAAGAFQQAKAEDNSQLSVSLRAAQFENGHVGAVVFYTLASGTKLGLGMGTQNATTSTGTARKSSNLDTYDFELVSPQVRSENIRIDVVMGAGTMTTRDEFASNNLLHLGYFSNAVRLTTILPEKIEIFSDAGLRLAFFGSRQSPVVGDQRVAIGRAFVRLGTEFRF